MTTYYIKHGKRYIPVGLGNVDIYDGIWVVNVKAGSRGGKNLLRYLGRRPKAEELQILAAAIDLEDDIIKIFSDIHKNNENLSWADLSRRVVLMIAEKEKQFRKQHNVNTKSKKLTIGRLR